MKNKIELKKMIIKSIFAIMIILIITSVSVLYQYKVYTTNFNNKIGEIAEKITSEYPDISRNELIKILNSKRDVDSNIFREYGIDLNEDSIVLKNEEFLTYFLTWNLGIIIVLSILLLIIFLKYNKHKDDKLKKITKYIEEINNKNYKLDIDDNTEDELSILKNEVYKVTVMLKEVAENSKKDKLNLKESLSDISHQLKTPLSSITIMLDNILDNPEMDNETRTSFIKDIKKQIININFLVNSLLKLSKLDANSIQFVNKEECIENIISKSIENVSTLCDLKNININCNGESDAKIYCDAKWQIEAITNILKNAIEHSNASSSIDISYEQNKMYSKIEIKDYGMGIDKDDLPHIFERFYKGKNSSSDSVGIGLALAKAIIENNGGYISVDSEMNKGTIFTIKYFRN